MADRTTGQAKAAEAKGMSKTDWKARYMTSLAVTKDWCFCFCVLCKQFWYTDWED